MEGDKKNEKGRVCVTGGTGFVASWLIMKLLCHGYSVNTTIRSSHSQSSKKDISFLTKLANAEDRLCIFEAELGNPERFKAAMEGCVGVFHVAHPVDFQETEAEETITEKSVRGTLGILQACLESGTVKRVVYTSSMAAATGKNRGDDDGVPLDEGSWSDVDYLRTLKFFGASYCISKTVTERAALEFAGDHGLDVITVLPSWIHGPFICPNLPSSVKASMAMIFGNEDMFKFEKNTHFVHTDDVAEAHIHLFEYPEAKGRYICSAAEATVAGLFDLLSSRYPEIRLLNPESVSDPTAEFRSLSSRKLLGTGFRYRYGIEEMFDDAIQCCKQKGFL